MYDRPRTTEQVLTLLSETPPRIAALTDGLAPAQLLSPPEPGEWTARDVLAHLRACADMWGKCIAELLSEDNPTIKAVNPRTWIERTNYREQEFQPSLQAFAAQPRSSTSAKGHGGIERHACFENRSVLNDDPFGHQLTDDCQVRLSLPQESLARRACESVK